MKNIGANDDAQIEMLFSAFDIDKSGLLDFRELCTGLSVLNKGMLHISYHPPSKFFLSFEDILNR